MIPADDKRFSKNNTAVILQFVPFFILGLIIPLLLLVFDKVDRGWFFIGPATWLLALMIKAGPFFISFYFPGVGKKWTTIYIKSIGEGLLSAFAELGLTIAFFLIYRDDLTMYKAISFGLGIGFAEVLFIAFLIGEEIESLKKEIQAASNKKFLLGYQLLERMLALSIHVFSRGIIALTILKDLSAWYMVLSFILFAFIDGWGGYIAARWDLKKNEVLKKTYGVIFITAFGFGLIFFSIYLLYD